MNTFDPLPHTPEPSESVASFAEPPPLPERAWRRRSRIALWTLLILLPTCLGAYLLYQGVRFLRIAPHMHRMDIGDRLEEIACRRGAPYPECRPDRR